MAEVLLDAVPELIAMATMDGIVEACRRVGFHGLDDACLEMVAGRESLFPTQVVKEGRAGTVYLRTAQEALASPRTNLDFWENELLVRLGARSLPPVDQYRIRRSDRGSHPPGQRDVGQDEGRRQTEHQSRSTDANSRCGVRLALERAASNEVGNAEGHRLPKSRQQ